MKRRKFLLSLLGVPFVGCAMPKIQQVPVPRFDVVGRTQDGSIRLERVAPYQKCDYDPVKIDYAAGLDMDDCGTEWTTAPIRIHCFDSQGYHVRTEL